LKGTVYYYFTWPLLRGIIYYYFTISVHLNYGLIRGVAIGVRGLIRGGTTVFFEEI
jgi:hypothetical protein